MKKMMKSGRASFPGVYQISAIINRFLTVDIPNSLIQSEVNVCVFAEGHYKQLLDSIQISTLFALAPILNKMLLYI